MITFRRSEYMNSTIFVMKRQTILTLLRVWVVIWLLAVPLYHIHPDAAHHHNESGPHHGGIAHTIFSRDLDGEFGSREMGFQDTKETLAHSTRSYQDSPELSFSLMSDASERKFIKSLLVPVSLISVAALSSAGNVNFAVHDESPIPHLLFILEFSSRPPPSVLI